MLKGRIPILFFVSILVWIFEISSYDLFARAFNFEFNFLMIPDILTFKLFDSVEIIKISYIICVVIGISSVICRVNTRYFSKK